MSREQYFEMTPAEFNACYEAWKDRERRAWANSASIVVMLANIHRKKGTPAFHLDDFDNWKN